MSQSLIVYHALFVLFLIMNSSIKVGKGVVCFNIGSKIETGGFLLYSVGSRVRNLTRFEGVNLSILRAICVGRYATD